MHAYLIIGTNSKEIEKKIEEISKKTKSEVIEFPLQKIADTKDLISFVKIKRSKKRAIVLKNIDSASTETLNAFLKNLEEPQENILYILTASSSKNVLSTILSRCKVLRVGKREVTEKEILEIKKFLKMDTINKMDYLDKFRLRPDAISFLETLIFVSHKLLKENPKEYSFVLKNASKTLENIKSNANVNLQFTIFCILLSEVSP